MKGIGSALIAPMGLLDARLRGHDHGKIVLGLS
jgi:hypothetical protein